MYFSTRFWSFVWNRKSFFVQIFGLISNALTNKVTEKSTNLYVCCNYERMYFQGHWV